MFHFEFNPTIPLLFFGVVSAVLAFRYARQKRRSGLGWGLLVFLLSFPVWFGLAALPWIILAYLPKRKLADVWYYLGEGNVHVGPLELEALRKAWVEKLIHDETLISDSRKDKWKPFAKHPDLKTKMASN